MKNMTIAVALLLILLPVAFGQSEDTLRGQTEISGAMTVMKFPSSFPGNLYKIGGVVDASYNVISNFAITGFYGYSPKSFNDYVCAYGRCTQVKVKATVQPIQFGGRANLIGRGPVIPYATGTVGLVRVGGGASADVFGTNLSASESMTKFGFTLGGGFIIRPTKHLDIKTDLRVVKGMQMEWLPVLGVGLGVRI